MGPERGMGAWADYRALASTSSEEGQRSPLLRRSCCFAGPSKERTLGIRMRDAKASSMCAGTFF